MTFISTQTYISKPFSEMQVKQGPVRHTYGQAYYSNFSDNKDQKGIVTFVDNVIES